MTAKEIKFGLLAECIPYARIGNGSQKLVIFPGLVDAAWDVRSRAWDLPKHYRRFASEFTVYVVSRKRQMPVGYTTRDMAADYAKAFKCEIGPAVVMGISLGGFIAQHFAAEFPQYVQRLVIACAADHQSDEGRLVPERWLALARQKRWGEFYFDIAKVTMQEFNHTFYQFLIPLLRMTPADPSDFLISLEASMAHDGSESLGKIRAPTLLIGGTDDVFFPPALLCETARCIPNATLRLIHGCRHGAYELHKDEFENAVMDFMHEHGTAATSPSASSAELPAGDMLEPVQPL
ncbi:MAG: alpha/beta hydrolase [Verrucomicrobiia bacterium]